MNYRNIFLQAQVLQYVKGLKVLDLSYNNISNFPPNFLEYNPRIIEIILRNNQIVFIPSTLLQVC